MTTIEAELYSLFPGTFFPLFSLGCRSGGALRAMVIPCKRQSLTARRHISAHGKGGGAGGRYARIVVCGGAAFAVFLLSDWGCIGSIAGKTCLTSEGLQVIPQARADPKKLLPVQAAAQATKKQTGKALGRLGEVPGQALGLANDALAGPGGSAPALRAFEQDGGGENNGGKNNNGIALGRQPPPGDVSPPRTMVELFRQIFRSRSKPGEERKAGREKGARHAGGKKARRAEKENGGEKAGQSRPGLPARRPRSLAAVSAGLTSAFRLGEVVAINLSDQGKARAEKLGFRVVSSSHFSNLRTKVTRLQTPPGFDTRDARQLLLRESPADRFELNKVYRLSREDWQTRLSRRTDDDRGKAPPAQRRRPGGKGTGPQRSCDADHCFARSIIRWKDELASCSKGLRVGIIDTGVDLAHAAFRGQDIKAGSFVSDRYQEAANEHGTAIASLLAGSRNSSMPGLIPDAEFFTANVFYLDQDGNPATDSVALLEALDWMDRFDVQLINMSFAGPEDALVHQALKRMTEKRVALVAASGNQGPAAPPLYPAAYPEVVAVTAVDKKLRNYRRANRGDHVDVAAPGVDIWAARSDGRGGYQSGTSFAAPHVTALLAIIYKNRKNAGAPDRLIGYLPIQDLGSPGRDPVYGLGLVRAPTDCRGSDQPPDLVAETPTRMRHGEGEASWALSPPAVLSSWQPLRPVEEASPSALSFR